MGVVVSAQSISKSYGAQDLFLDASFELQSSTIYGLVGVSGSGKTTLLHSLVGFVPLDDGSITYKIDDKEFYVQKHSKQLRKRLGFASQEPSLYRKLTAYENLRYFGALYGVFGKKLQERISYCLELVGLQHNKDQYAEFLSEGMLKRLDIACALVHDPDVLILDEPMADLDSILRRQIWELLHQIRDSGKLVIVSSHILDDFDLYCDGLCVIHGANVRYFEKVDDLLTTYEASAIVRIRVPPEQKQILIDALTGHKKLEITNILDEGHFLEVESTDYTRIIFGIMNLCKKHKIPVLDIEYNQKPMSSIFESIVRENDNLPS